MFFAALCAAPRPCAAQASSPLAEWPGPAADPGAEARRTALYRAGVDAASAGRWAEARQKFSEAVAMRVSPKVCFSLAQADEQLGLVASAAADYTRALESARALGDAEVVKAALQAGAAIAPRVPYVRILVTGATDATASLDGAPIAVGAPIPVDPGAHKLLVRAAGMRDVASSIALGERQQLDFPVLLEPIPPSPSAPPNATTPVTPIAPAPATTQAPAPAPAPRNDPSSEWRPWRTVALVSAGAGVLALGISGGFAIDASSKNNQSNDSGCQGDQCSPAAASVRRDALWAANASTVAFIVGSALVASGVVLWFVAPPRDSGASVGVTPTALTGGAGLMATGAWW
jgi:hypothetical protein